MLLPAPTAAQLQLETSTWDTLAGSEALTVFYGPSEMTLAPVCHPSCCSLLSRTHLSHWAVTGVVKSSLCGLCPQSATLGSSSIPLCTSVHLAASDRGC